MGIPKIKKDWLDYYNTNGPVEVSSAELPSDQDSALFGRRGLGLRARLNVMLALSNRPHTTVATLAGVELDALRQACEPNRAGQVSYDTFHALVNWYSGFVGRPIDEDQFLIKKFDGPNAVANFIGWLTNEPPVLGDSTELLSLTTNRIFHPSPDRDHLLRDVADFLKRDLNRPSTKILQVVLGSGMPGGLRALANAIATKARESDQKREWPLFYLPATRYGPHMGDRANAKISFATLVANLDSYLANGTTPATVPLTSVPELRAAIERIRKRMAQKPITLIIGGWAGSPSSLPRLHSLVVDDGVVDLLEQILHPHLGESFGQLEAGTFYQNRILLLCERGPTGLEEFRTARDLHLTPPASIEELARQQGRPHATELIALSRANDLVKNDSALTLINDWIEQLRGQEAYDREEAQSVLQSFTFDDLIARWRTSFHGVDARAELLILRFIALGQDGIRLSSLSTLLDKWVAINADERDLPDIWKVDGLPNSVDSVRKVVDNLEKRGLILIGQDDAIDGLDGDGSAARMDDHPKGPDFLDFPAVVFRDGLIRDLIRTTKPFLIARMHRLIAELALSHQTSIGLHGTWNQVPDARQYRRLIQALFHGFASLANNWFVDRALQKIPHALPARRLEAYERLYAVFYRGIIEVPPNWELARVLGREDIKIELILTAMNADQTWPSPWYQLYGLEPDDEADKPSELGPRVSKLFELRPISVSLPIIVDQYTALARAAYHATRYDLANRAITDCRAQLAQAAKEASLDLVEARAKADC